MLINMAIFFYRWNNNSPQLEHNLFKICNIGFLSVFKNYYCYFVIMTNCKTDLFNILPGGLVPCFCDIVIGPPFKRSSELLYVSAHTWGGGGGGGNGNWAMWDTFINISTTRIIIMLKSVHRYILYDQTGASS